MTMKTITMTEFRAEPGERLRDVQRGGESFLITKAGKPAARLVPVNAVTDEPTTIRPDGTIVGSPPLTMRQPALIEGGY
jgi:prevent-host-death family protein